MIASSVAERLDISIRRDGPAPVTATAAPIFATPTAETATSLPSGQPHFLSGTAATIEAIGAKLTADKRQDREWDDKTCRQAEFIYGLFGRFLLEEHGLSDLAGLRQTHCDAFDGFLRGLFKSVGKSPKDKDRSINELRRISEAKELAERGLEPGTRTGTSPSLGRPSVAPERQV